jgi:site-specific recombinase XerD
MKASYFPNNCNPSALWCVGYPNFAPATKYVKKAGIRKRVGVHTLRHTFGAHKADKNMGIATLQEVMGHKKKETTLKYIHLAKTNLRQEMTQTAL